MPLTTGKTPEISIENDTITLKRTLTAGDKLVIKVTNKEGDVVKGEGTFEYTVAEAEAAVPTTVAGVKATVNEAEPKDGFVAGDVIKLTPDVRDQFNTPVTQDAKVRYVVTEGADLLAAKGKNTLGSNEKTADADNAEAATLTVEKPGTVKVDVFNVKNGNKYTVTLEVGAKKLETITSPKDPINNAVNHEAFKSAAIKATEGAAFTADMVKFHVTDANGKVTEDLKVEAKTATETKDGLTKGDVYFTGKTTKDGKYNVTPYVGDTFTAEGVIKGGAVAVTSTVNKVATKIEAFELGTLKKGQAVKKAVKVLNKHGEDITKEVAEADKQDAGLIFTAYQDGAKVGADKSVTATKKYDDKEKVLNVTFTGKVDGEYTLRATVTGTAVTLDVPVTVETTQLEKIAFNSKNIYEGVISGDKATYHIIKATDSKGDAIIPKELTGWKVTSDLTGENEKSTSASVVYVVTDKDGKLTDTGATKDNAEAIALKVDTEKVASIKALKEDKLVKYNVVAQAAKGEAKAIEASATVKVQAARVADKVAVTPSTVNVGLGGTTKIIVNVTDQYGDAFTLAEEAVPAATGEKFKIGKVAQSKDAKNKNIEGQYEFTATANDTGSHTIEVAVGDKKATVNVNVAPASELVKEIEITGEGVKDGKAENILAANKQNAIDLNVVGKDAAGNAINVKQDEVIWTSSDATVATIDKTTGEVKTLAVEAGKDKEVTFTADLFGKKQSITFTVSAEKSKLKAGTLAIAKPEDVDGDKETEGVQIVLGADSQEAPVVKDGAITVTFTGTDQYGDNENFTPVVNATSYNASVATATAEDAVVKITAVKAGETQIRVTVDADEIIIPVLVKQEAVDAIEAAKEAKKVEEATESVNALFDDNENKEALAEDVDQDAITTAEKLVNALKDGDAKTELQKDIATAKQLLIEKESTENAKKEANQAIEKAVTALKGDSKPAIATEATSLTGLVNTLDDSEVAIAWKSSNSSKLTDQGTVGTVSQEETVTLTATVSKDKGETKTVNYTVTISSEGKITKIEVAA